MDSPKASTSKKNDTFIDNNDTFLDSLLSSDNKRKYIKKTKDYISKEIENLKKQKMSYENAKAFIEEAYKEKLIRIINIDSDIKNIKDLIQQDIELNKTAIKIYKLNKELVKSYIKYIFPKKKGLLKTVGKIMKPKPKYEKLEDSSSLLKPENITIENIAESLLILCLIKSTIISMQEQNIKELFMD